MVQLYLASIRYAKQNIWLAYFYGVATYTRDFRSKGTAPDQRRVSSDNNSMPFVLSLIHVIVIYIMPSVRSAHKNPPARRVTGHPNNCTAGGLGGCDRFRGVSFNVLPKLMTSNYSGAVKLLGNNWVVLHGLFRRRRSTKNYGEYRYLHLLK